MAKFSENTSAAAARNVNAAAKCFNMNNDGVKFELSVLCISY